MAPFFKAPGIFLSVLPRAPQLFIQRIISRINSVLTASRETNCLDTGFKVTRNKVEDSNSEEDIFLLRKTEN